MRALYHFVASPFSRRARLALMHKGLEVTLKDGRAEPALHEEAKKLWPLRTMPVLVEGDGRVIGDSTAITHYLDGAYPETPRVWPVDPRPLAEALAIAALVDGALDTIINLGTRYHALHAHGSWPAVQKELLGRAQGALDALAERAGGRTGRTLTDAGWCGADMWLYTATAWIEAMPERAKANPNIAQIRSLPWTLPAPIARWAETFRGRADVKNLG